MRKSISFQFKKRINEWSEVKTKNMSKIYTLHVLNLKQSLPLHLMGLFLYILQRENPSCHMHLSLSFSWPTLSSISLWKLEKYNVCEGPFSDNVAQVEGRTLGLVVVVLRDWAWFTAAKWADYKPSGAQSKNLTIHTY